MERTPKTGLPVLDNILAAVYLLFAGLNWMLTPSIFADLMVGVGAGATALLTFLRIYEHLIGEPVSETLFNIEQEAS
jgi:hypothetical protein